ncbi:hypothetical protein GW17_00048206 [Ensete ventricosum]|nr:hypothetical protein GW17_00048206 [Ensete ventricosum]
MPGLGRAPRRCLFESCRLEIERGGRASLKRLGEHLLQSLEAGKKFEPNEDTNSEVGPIFGLAKKVDIKIEDWIAGLHHRHYSRCFSAPSLLPLVAVAAAPLALGQVSSSPRFYCSPMPLPLLLGAALSKQLSLCASPRPYLSLLLT